MKLILNGCALAALTLGLAGAAGAQVQVNPAPIHAVPSDPDGTQGALISKPGDGGVAPEPMQRALAAVTDPAAAPQEAVLTAQEGAFFVALGHRITDAAAAYEDYVRAAGAIDARFTGAGQVQKALEVAEAYNVAQLQEGQVAYAAVLALRSQAFVDSVRAQGDPVLAARLEAAPEQVMALAGANEAARDVSGVMRVQASAVLDAGAAISQAAYTVQHQSWSRDAVPQPERVLASAKASALKVLTADERAERRLLDSIGATPQSQAGGGSAPPEVVRGLALAAVAIVGQAGDAQETRFEVLLRDLRSEDCLQMAKMNLNQCLAVAGPQYEDVFCLGRHAVHETGQCLVAAADAGPAAPAMRTASLDPDYGSERAQAYAASGR